MQTNPMSQRTSPHFPMQDHTAINTSNPHATVPHTLDPHKHSVVSFYVSYEGTSSGYQTEWSNPLFNQLSEFEEKNGTQQASDSPDRDENGQGNGKEDEDEKDYMVGSDDDASVSSESMCSKVPQDGMDFDQQVEIQVQ